MNFKHFTYRLSFVFVAWIYASAMHGQNSDAPKSLGSTFYLRNCNVVQKPGSILTNQNVLIKEGLIIDIGSLVKPSFDAQIIMADSMYVYAGFIDGHSNTGVAKAESKDRPKVQNPDAPPMDVAGIVPHIHAIESYKSSEKSVSDMRAVGFTVSQVAPRGLMLPGQSAVYMLGDGSPDKMLLKTPTVQNLAIEPARGVFPSTSIGVIAKFRELYRNANIAGTHDEKFKANPAGLARPDYSKEVMALYPITNKKQAVNVVATYTKDVHKAISLRSELGFDMTLVEVKQGWHYINKIKTNNIGVMLSIDLPDEEKPKEVKDSSATKKDTIIDKTPINEKKNPELDAYDAKRLAANKEYVGQAAVFEKNSIPFAFSMLSGKHTDLKKNIQRMIKAGLSEQYALAALTTHPAKMLGMSNILGTVEKGKIANLVVTQKPYFDEKSSIKYVFIDGKKYDYSSPPKKPNDIKNESSKEGLLAGIWSYNVIINGQAQLGKMTITKDGSNYNVILVDDSTPNDVDNAQDLKVDGSKMTFYINAEMEQPVKIDVDLVFDSKTYKGTVAIPDMGSFPISGDWLSDPK
jgi:hypothetical protein